MAIKKLNPYLQFDGRAEEALKLYERALGGKIESLLRFGEVEGPQVPASHKGRVMHSVLAIGGERIMVSDTPPSLPVPTGSGVSVMLDIDDPADLAHKFEALSTGGKITMPLHETFWGAKFGMLTDAFGVRWLFNCDHKI
jgi:PhnB protein